jgi:catechol 2,3-dioxygenase-like lactoylglutathione lyase family enzyme
MKLKSLLIACAIAAIPQMAGAQTSAPAGPTIDAAEPYGGAFYKRQLFVVTDMERALTLWRDVLGLQAGEITTSGRNSYSREVFNVPTNVAMRFCTLSAGPTQQRTLALLEVRGTSLPRKSGIRTTAAVINANGRLNEIIETVRAQGLTVFSQRVLESTTQGNGLEQGFLDWDGNVIVLYEFPNADPPSRR